MWWQRATDPHRFARTESAQVAREAATAQVEDQVMAAVDGRRTLTTHLEDTCSTANTGWWPSGPPSMRCTIGFSAVLGLPATTEPAAATQAQAVLGSRCEYPVSSAGRGTESCDNVVWYAPAATDDPAAADTIFIPGAGSTTLSDGGRLDGPAVVADQGADLVLVISAVEEYVARELP